MFDIFAHRTLVGLAPPGHGVRSPIVQCVALAVKYLGQIRADVIQVDRDLLAAVGNCDFLFRHISQGAARIYRIAWLDWQLADNAADLRLDHMLHLHGFHD